MIMKRVHPSDEQIAKLTPRITDTITLPFSGQASYLIRVSYFRDEGQLLWEYWPDFDIWWVQER